MKTLPLARINYRQPATLVGISSGDIPMVDDVPPVLTDNDHKAIAKNVVDMLQGPFDIPAKEHYDSHQRLNEVLKDVTVARSIVVRTFVGIVVAGALLLAGFAVSSPGIVP